MFLPKRINKIIVPPIKCQGIKTKLIEFIASNIEWEGKGRWIEPFMGSGVVAFNILPERALLCDTNKHIISFYNAIKNKEINEKIVREFLYEYGSQLSERDGDFFYQVREEFNSNPNPLLFLFLNRACFNGLMRFNSKGQYNVPYNHKANRFSPAYLTKISNQVYNVRVILESVDWQFATADWSTTLSMAAKNDFVYLDPPYIGRHTDYFNSWSYDNAVDMANQTHALKCGYALSMWKENVYRINEYVNDYWSDNPIATYDHFYHIGSKESLRHKMIEALILKPGYIKQYPFTELENSKQNLLAIL